MCGFGFDIINRFQISDLDIFQNHNNILTITNYEITNQPLIPLGFENFNKINIYPIIGSHLLNIENVTIHQLDKLRVYDVFGREVKNINVESSFNKKTQINTSKLSDGLYFIFFNTFEDSLDKNLKFIIRN